MAARMPSLLTAIYVMSTLERYSHYINHEYFRLGRAGVTAQVNEVSGGTHSTVVFITL